MKLVSRKGCGIVLLAILLAVAAFVAFNWDIIQRIFLGGVKVYETEAPALPDDLASPAILVFSKTNGFRHEEAIPAANKLFADFAQADGWGYYETENGATFTPENLARFDAVVFNNVSGDVFTPEQREALRGFIENGGGFVGIHGSGGDNSYDWRWYADELIGAQFIGHPMDPQFQEARLLVEDAGHPATSLLPAEWVRTDEWYSFESSPRAKGYNILLTIDEASYSPVGLFGSELNMGEDHPMAWWHCQGDGRAFFSALGHTAESYAEGEHIAMLLGATRWALRIEGDGCGQNVNASEETTQAEATAD